MKTVVLAGGGLTCWYVVGKLVEQGHEVEVWYAEADQVDEKLTASFIQYLNENNITYRKNKINHLLGEIGLSACRGLARHRNGYWNTTGLLRVGLITAASGDLLTADSGEPFEIAHGCVGLGNDQQRFANLFASLLPDHTVRTFIPVWAKDSNALSRTDMVEAITKWVGKPIEALEDKKIWSTDGSVLGVSHEGTEIECHTADWTSTPFVMSQNPLDDSVFDTVRLTFENGLLSAVDDETGSAYELLSAANYRAGRRGIGRIGVMEDRIKGTKCRGVYEAPGMTLIGSAWASLLELCVPENKLSYFDQLSEQLANDIYRGQWHSENACNNRKQIEMLCADVSGEVEVEMRAGHLLVKKAYSNSLGAHVEQRFAHSGVCWN